MSTIHRLNRASPPIGNSIGHTPIFSSYDLIHPNIDQAADRLRNRLIESLCTGSLFIEEVTIWDIVSERLGLERKWNWAAAQPETRGNALIANQTSKLQSPLN